MSEITRSIQVQRKAAADPGRLSTARSTAATNVERLQGIFGMRERGDAEVVDLETEELGLFARLTSDEGARSLGLRFAIQPGEAACVALAVKRGWVLATDDQDALKALEGMSRGHACERIRRLLQRAADEGLIGQEEANDLHAKMRHLGFRDSEPPFA